MNPQQSLPMAGITGEWIGFFKLNNVGVADLGTGKISKEAVKAFEERIDKILEQT